MDWGRFLYGNGIGIDPGSEQELKKTFGDVGPWPTRFQDQSFDYREVGPAGVDFVEGAGTGAALAGLFPVAGVANNRIKALDKFLEAFSGGKDAILYHGTMSENAGEIMKKGFDFNKRGFGHGSIFGYGAYLTPDIKQAAYWGPKQVEVKVPSNIFKPVLYSDYWNMPEKQVKNFNPFMVMYSPEIGRNIKPNWLADTGGDQAIVRFMDDYPLLRPQKIHSNYYEDTRATKQTQTPREIIEFLNRLKGTLNE